MIIGINHITFGVTDIDRAVRFYTEALGGVLKAQWEQGAYLELGTLWLALNLENEAQQRYEGTVNHIALSVDPEAFHGLRRKLIDYGVTTYKENRSEGASFYFKDPDGNNLEIHVGDLQSRLAAMNNKTGN